MFAEKFGDGVAKSRRLYISGAEDAVDAVVDYLNQIYAEILEITIPGTEFGGEVSAYMKDKKIRQWVRRHEAEKLYRIKYNDRLAR